MRKIARVALTSEAQNEINRLAGVVMKTRGRNLRRSSAQKLWKNKNRRIFQQVSDALAMMASGRGRCMYCEDSAGTDIEHFYPKDIYPERSFLWENYLWACSHCNSNLKRKLFPMSGSKPLLIDPSTVDPTKHLVFQPLNGEYRSIGRVGRESIRVFSLNCTKVPRNLPGARKEAFERLQIMLMYYDQLIQKRKKSVARRIKGMFKTVPFAGLFPWLITIALGPVPGRRALLPGVAALVRKHDVSSW